MKFIQLKITVILIICLLFHSLMYAQENGKYNSLEEALKSPEKVYSLDLTGQELTLLPNEILNCVNLETLNLSVNHFTEIPPVIFKMTHLKSLSLSGAWSYNDKYDREEYLIDTIPAELFKLVNLEFLDLSYNMIANLPKEFSRLQKLSTLDLYHNYLPNESLKSLYNIPTLQYLDISGNDITDVSDSISLLKNLIGLYLDNSWAEGVPVGTCLNAFPVSVCQLSQLEILSISGQCLKSIPREIGNLKSLRELHAGYNEFLSIPEEITQLDSLTVLNIDLLCIGNMLGLCEIDFVFPPDMCRMKKLTSIICSSRKTGEEEMKRIQSCLPECKVE